MKCDLTGKISLVTGAARGIGQGHRHRVGLESGARRRSGLQQEQRGEGHQHRAVGRPGVVKIDQSFIFRDRLDAGTIGRAGIDLLSTKRQNARRRIGCRGRR